MSQIFILTSSPCLKGRPCLHYIQRFDPLDILLQCAVGERTPRLGNMFGNSRYFGLKGTKLNVAVGVLAGLDFL